MQPVFKLRVQEALREAGYQESETRPATEPQLHGWQVWNNPPWSTSVVFFGADALALRGEIAETLRKKGWIVENTPRSVYGALTVSHPE